MRGKGVRKTFLFKSPGRFHRMYIQKDHFYGLLVACIQGAATTGDAHGRGGREAGG